MLTKADIAARFDVTEQTVANWTIKGSRGKFLAALKIGNEFRYTEEAVEAFVTFTPAGAKPSLRAKKTSPEVLAKLRAQGFKV